MSFLLESTRNIDTELDALFKSQPPGPPNPISTPAPVSPSKKRKLENPKHDGHSKKTKSDTVLEKAKQKARKPKPKPAVEEEEEDDEDKSDVETNYLRGKANRVQKSDSGPEDSEDEESPSALVHESLAGKGKNKSKHRSKQKYIPPDEPKDQRDQRTIFIGNLSLEVAQKKPLQKQLQRHILSFTPTAKIESIRFRSIPFSAPTSQLPTSSPEDTTKPKHKKVSQRDHDRERTSSWRQHQHQHHEPDDNAAKKDEKNYLNPNQKKKIAFINQEFHSSADTVHAYLVFALAVPKEDRPANLPPLPPCMDPYEAAKEAVRKADGTLFLERMLRVDLVGKKTASEEGEVADPKLTLFVGNLDLAGKEEDLRVFFETLMKKERGDPPEEDRTEEAKRPSTWVTRVRIIRDKDTQLGKGFGYVQFLDRECIDEILTMDVSLLKFAKRKLRVQRCKTIPGTKLPSSVKLNTATAKTKADKQNEKSHSRPRTSLPQAAPIVIPKGDPSLGQKLVNLSKDQRKKVKAGDADRVARRLAKKKARMAMGTHKDRHGEDSGEKKRERARKGSGALLGKKGKDVKKKGRMRSENSLQKRNIKK